VLREGSCLYYLLPDKCDSSVTDRLRRAKTFEPLPARTNKFRNSFIPYCLEHFDWAWYFFLVLAGSVSSVCTSHQMISLYISVYYCVSDYDCYVFISFFLRLTIFSLLHCIYCKY